MGEAGKLARGLPAAGPAGLDSHHVRAEFALHRSIELDGSLVAPAAIPAGPVPVGGFHDEPTFSPTAGDWRNPTGTRGPSKGSEASSVPRVCAWRRLDVRGLIFTIHHRKAED